ncbi:MAG: ATP-binding protein, partial [Proteobacteria bacterium]
ENLLSNAVKYGDATGQITLSITTEGAQVRTTVHNLGNPIPETERADLFKRYKRAKAAEESSKEGWGIGLALVYGAVSSHGGTIQVESTEEHGTTFTMQMPVSVKAGAQALA